MQICLVAAPAGSRLYVCDVAFSLSEKLLAQQQRSAWRLLSRPFRSLLIRASQLEIILMFCSNQPSSVTFRRLHPGSYPALALGSYQATRACEEAPSQSHDSSAACVSSIRMRSWPCDAFVMRGSWIFHLSLAAWLAANGLCLAWFNPPSLQSAITYETTTVSHPVSHLPRFHTSQQPNHSCEINGRCWGVVGDSLITPAHIVLQSGE